MKVTPTEGLRMVGTVRKRTTKLCCFVFLVKDRTRTWGIEAKSTKSKNIIKFRDRGRRSSGYTVKRSGSWTICPWGEEKNILSIRRELLIFWIRALRWSNSLINLVTVDCIMYRYFRWYDKHITISDLRYLMFTRHLMFMPTGVSLKDLYLVFKTIRTIGNEIFR